MTDDTMATSPEMLHIGDELLTADGWQTVLGVYRGGSVNGELEDDQVTVFTAERDIFSDGWLLDPADLTPIRRHNHGPCVINFVTTPAGCA